MDTVKLHGESELIARHEHMAKQDPKAYYRDNRAAWADVCESQALKHEHAAAAERNFWQNGNRASNESVAQRHDALARRWRVLIRN
jgi:hypothetical protein